MRKIVVGKKFNNKKLIDFLTFSFDGLALNNIYKALRKKDVLINNIRIKENVVVKEDDEVTVYLDDKFLYRSFELKIVYEDENILIVNKPVGIEVVNDSKNSLTALVKSRCNTCEPCHRLDMNTSGIVLFAKNTSALEFLTSKFKTNEIEKFYKCTVYGIPKEPHKLITAYLFKDTKKSLVYISDVPKKGYLKIITEYTILSKNTENNTSVLEVILHTGRTHQIRAHLAHIGYPIIGDGKYGINKVNKLFKRTTQDLQAYKIKFKFTGNNELLSYLNEKEYRI